MVLGNELAKSKWLKSVKSEISDLTVAEEGLTVDGCWSTVDVVKSFW